MYDAKRTVSTCMGYSECIPELWEESMIVYFKKVIKKILITILYVTENEKIARV